MITTSGLSYSYDGVHVLRYPDLEIVAGDTMLIMGHSGSGKSTLLHLLAALLQPASGCIQLNNTSITTLKPAGLNAFRKEHIGVVFQKAHFVKALSVKDNLLLAAHGRKGEEADMLLENLGIAHLRHRLPGTLSQGELQRAAVARAVINRPSLLLADEPTSNLDDRNASQVISLLQQQAAAVGATLMIVTHDARLRQIISKCIMLT